ncbi:MAG: hypothetical protein GX591_10300 [Planctomycetes bacterium]|nr:hypothetical protein [Planctomycetota bacterium]
MTVSKARSSRAPAARVAVRLAVALVGLCAASAAPAVTVLPDRMEWLDGLRDTTIDLGDTGLPGDRTDGGVLQFQGRLEIGGVATVGAGRINLVDDSAALQTLLADWDGLWEPVGGQFSFGDALPGGGGPTAPSAFSLERPAITRPGGRLGRAGARAGGAEGLSIEIIDPQAAGGDFRGIAVGGGSLDGAGGTPALRALRVDTADAVAAFIRDMLQLDQWLAFTSAPNAIPDAGAAGGVGLGRHPDAAADLLGVDTFAGTSTLGLDASPLFIETRAHLDRLGRTGYGWPAFNEGAVGRTEGRAAVQDGLAAGESRRSAGRPAAAGRLNVRTGAAPAVRFIGPAMRLDGMVEAIFSHAGLWSRNGLDARDAARVPRGGTLSEDDRPDAYPAWAAVQARTPAPRGAPDIEPNRLALEGLGLNDGAAGALMLGPDASLAADLLEPLPAGYDQIAVHALGMLDGTLSLVLDEGFIPAGGEAFCLPARQGVSGWFSGLTEGQILAAGGGPFLLTGQAGWTGSPGTRTFTGDDVAVQFIAHPPAVSVLVLGVPDLGLHHRR